MRTLNKIDPELGHVVKTIDEDDIDVTMEVELGPCESLSVWDSPYSEIYVTGSLVQSGKSKIRIKTTIDKDKDRVRYTLKLPEDAVGCIYIVRSMRAYKYILG